MSPLSNLEGVTTRRALPSSSILLSAARLAAELFLIVGCWFAMDAFLYLRLSPAAFVATYLAWVVAFAFAGWGRGSYQSRGVGWAAVEFGFPVVALTLISPQLRHPLTAPTIFFAAGMMCVVCQGWRRWPTPDQVNPFAELLRRILLFAIPFGLFLPFITDREIGGVDARWYTNMLTDFILQSRAGVFPVFIGQGFHAFNGAVHPFRCAPLFLWVSGIWDVVTFRALPIYSLQHLTAVSGALVGTVGFYLGLTGLNRNHRWAAFGLSVVYLSSPAILQILYRWEMYMTWMAVVCLPFVMYANGRILLRGDREGWIALGASLALAWMGHPPVALIVTLISIFIQVIGLGLRKIDWRLIRNVSWSVVVFSLLSGYYLISMGELPSQGETKIGLDLLLVLAVLTVAVAALRAFYGRQWGWCGALIPAGLLLYRTSPLWLVWSAVFVSLVALAWAADRAPFERKNKSSPMRVALVATLIAAAAAWLVAQKQGLGGHLETLDLLEEDSYARADFFLPITRALLAKSDFQPGLAVWVCLALGLILFWVRGSRAGGVFVSLAALLVCLFIKLPWSSEFLVGFAPPGLARIVNLPLTLRLLPVCIIVICTGTYLIWCTLRPTPRWFAIGSVLAIGLVGWSIGEARTVLAYGRTTLVSRASSARHLASENVKLERFAYDLLQIPEYFSHGPTDPTLESRLLNSDQHVIFGECELIEVMERNGETRQLTLHSLKNDPDPGRTNLSPTLTVAPGEHLLLHFKFAEDVNYTGMLIFTGYEGDYREYLLPEAGLSRAFGMGENHPQLISLWNSGTTAGNYLFSLLRGEDNPFKADADFATVVISHYKEEFSRVALQSLIPYRARIILDQAGYLETPRVFLPGYTATVDGRPASVEASNQKLVMIPIQSGTHQVELKFIGTVKLRAAAWISGLAWVGFLALIIRGAHEISKPRSAGTIRRSV